MRRALSLALPRGPLLRPSTATKMMAATTTATHHLPLATHNLTQPQPILARHFTKKGKNRSSEHHHAPASTGGGEGSGLVDMNKLKQRMEKVVQALQKDFAGLRGGKADPSMFDHLVVSAYGKTSPMSDVAQVTLKTPTMAVINVYDPELVGAVSTAISDSKLELQPRIEGNVVSVPLPKPSAEMRESMVKLANQFTEKAKQNIRKVRREGMDAVKAGKDNISEDEVRRSSKQIDALTDGLVKKAQDLFDKKKKEITTV